ncbi:MAG: ABC transporter ATP-binding protein [Rhodanobacteraceae bacterium]|nr:ABC transporter ATP-binding protein [Rhodanobacteraceae bacterium]
MAVAPAGEAVVRLRGLLKRYAARVAVDGVDLCVQRGRMHGLIGPDGAGKSSLMKIVAGVLTHDGGTVEVFGQAIASERDAERVKQRIGLMPQGLGQNLYAELSIEENIDFFARLRGVDEQALAARKRQLLAMTRLERFRDRPMKKLSGGMKQKLGLVCTLIHEPELIILDEPTTGVDPVSRRDFWAILDELVSVRGLTALVSTAYMDEAARFATATMMLGGRVLAEGTPAELLAALPATVVSVKCREQVEAQRRLGASFRDTILRGPWLRTVVDAVPGEDAPARARSAEARVREALAGLAIEALDVDAPDLEDLFIARAASAGVAAARFAPAPAPAKRMERTHAPDYNAIEARGLVRQFGDFRAVDQVSFTVKPGEIFGLLGANGAGKTTVIKMLNGIQPPNAGSGAVAGADMIRAPGQIKRRIGYMSQAFSLYLDMTVRENLRLFAAIYGVPRARRDERVRELMRLCDIEGIEDMLAGDLPMGRRQRLALACALVHEPEVVFLDEPTSGVDPVGRRRFWDILFRLARHEGVALLITTHYMSEAEQCDHISLLYAGRVVADASPEQLKAELAGRRGELWAFDTPTPQATVKALQAAGFAGASLYGTAVHVLDPDGATLPARVAGVLAPLGLQAGPPHRRPLTMEDVFVERVLELEREAAQ